MIVFHMPSLLKFEPIGNRISEHWFRLIDLEGIQRYSFQAFDSRCTERFNEIYEIISKNLYKLHPKPAKIESKLIVKMIDSLIIKRNLILNYFPLRKCISY